MALQEVCGFQDTPIYPRWNTPASLSMATGHNTLHSGGWTGEEPNATGDGEGPLSLYVPDPAHFTQGALQAPAPPFRLCHGTTTLAFAFQGGIIAAADSRASCRGLICSPDARKILPVHSRLVMTMSGSGADCQLWKGILARELRLYHLRHRRQLTPGGAAKLLAHMLHPFKGTEVCVATILCGWEGAGERKGRGGGGGGVNSEPIIGAGPQVKGGASVSLDSSSLSEWPSREGGTGVEPEAPEGNRSPALPGRGAGVRGPGEPRLYYVCSDGTFLQGELFSVGSGSPYAYSVLDGGVRWGMGVAEAVRLAREAVYRATHRDAYSGNCVDLYHVTSAGWTSREKEDLKEEYYREREREREGRR